MSTPIFLFCSVLGLSNYIFFAVQTSLHLFASCTYFPWFLELSKSFSLILDSMDFTIFQRIFFPHFWWIFISFFLFLCQISTFISRYENYFLAPAHFEILKVTVDTKPSQDDSFSLKIFLFLSFQIDHKIEKGIILNRIKPHTAKGFTLYDSNSWPTEPGIHHATLHSLRKYPQRDDAKCLGIGDLIAPTKTIYVWNGLWHQSPP